MRSRFKKKKLKKEELNNKIYFRNKALKCFDPETRMIYNYLSLTDKERLNMLDDVIMNTRKNMGLWNE